VALALVLAGASSYSPPVVAAFQGAPASQAAPAAVVDRWEADMLKFEAQDAAAPPPKNGVVFIGSSSIGRWNLADAFPSLGAAAINRGFGGSFMADAVRYVDRIVVPYQPRTVVLYEGDNDLTTLTAEQIGQQFGQFVDKVHTALPAARIIVISIKPSVRRWEFVDKMRAANALIKKQCEGKPFLTYVDVETPMLGADGKPRPELYVEDNLHMSAEGYKIWTALLQPLLVN
jgi:lysophospholipase L1-like esterase